MDRYNNRLLLVARALEIIPGRGYLNFPSYKKKKQNDNYQYNCIGFRISIGNVV